MALITLPPREGQNEGEAPTPQEGCCTPDAQSRAALIVYLLSLLLKKVGGTDWTDCASILEQWRTYQSYDQSHVELIELDLLGDLLQANGIVVTGSDALTQSACLRNNLPPYALEALQFVLWNLIVNELTP